MRVLGMFALGALLVLAGCAKKEAGPGPVPVKAETVATQEVRPAWRYSGEIRPYIRVQMAFKVPGYIAALHQVRGADGRLRNLQAGDEVPAGTALAHLRRSDYEASVSTALGQEGATQGLVAASQAKLDQAKADQTKADLDFERAQALYAAKAMTRPDYDEAVQEHATTTAGVQAAIQQIEAYQGEFHSAQAQLTSARINLSDTALIAPMRAVIVEKDVERGDLVASGTTAFTLDDTSVVKFSFGVPDSMLGHFKMGAPVPVELEALRGRILTGRVTQIAASANTQSRVFNIEVSLPNRDGSLKVGMIASTRIEDANPQSVPVVPMTALVTTESGSNGYSIFTIKERDGKQFAQLKSVRIGETIGKSVVINEGLIPGEQIIVNRTYQMDDGSPVRIVD